MISIIMSAFNSSNTIGRAIESVLNQSYSDIELIIVNDCSTDTTEEIIKSYSAKDNRIRLLNHSKNLGAGCARKTGIENSIGDFTTFLDSDDYIDSDYIQILYNNALKSDADIIVCGSFWENENGEIVNTLSYPNKLIIKSDKPLVDECRVKYFLNTMLIKKSIWDNVVYSERRFFEDLITLNKIFYFAKSVFLLDYIGYHYYQNPKSLIHTSSSLKIDIYKTLVDKDVAVFFSNFNNSKEQEKFLYRYKYLLNQVYEEEEVLKYKLELDELYDYFQSITNT